MKKRVLSLLLVLLLWVLWAVPVSAKASRVVDEANLLTSAEEKNLRSELDEISQKHQVDVVVVTVDSTGQKSPRDFADDFYDTNGYGYGSRYDGILLLISMEHRDWYISTSGVGIDALSDRDIDDIGDQIVGDLGSGDYADAFHTFAQACDHYIDIERNGTPFPLMMSLLVSLGIGLVAALIATAVMRGQLKSVRSQSGAASYVKPGTMRVTNSSDLFLYRDVQRRAKPKDTGSSTHRASSGRSHGGGGGKF